MVASPSEAKAVMPTVVPMAAFSLTALAAASLSLSGVMSNSSTSVTAMAKDWVELEPSWEVAVTPIVIEASLSRSKLAPAAMRTSPVTASITKRPPASFARL